MSTISHALVSALWMAFSMGWEILWALILGFALSGIVQAVVTKCEMSRLLPDSSPRSILIATRPRGRIVVMFLRGCGACSFDVSQGGRFCRGDGLSVRLYQSGPRTRHHSRRADGMAVRCRRVRRRF